MTLTGPWPPYNFVSPVLGRAAAVSPKAVRHSTIPRAIRQSGSASRRCRRAPPKPAPPPRARSPASSISPIRRSLDVLDNLLNRGVVLNADIILALANVDLVYLQLSALLCAADRVLSDDGAR